MEGRKQSGSSYYSSSSFTSDLFGSKESSASTSSEILGSIFAPSSKVLGRESVRPDLVEKNRDPASQVWNTKAGPSGSIFPVSEGDNVSISNKEASSFYQQEEKMQPCHLSSSIYYGGQEVYSRPQNTRSSGYTTFSKDGEEDDSGSASRGNWWQGSLYY